MDTIHRMTVDLRGPQSQKKYRQYVTEIKKVARKYGARVRGWEYTKTSQWVKKRKKQMKRKKR